VSGHREYQWIEACSPSQKNEILALAHSGMLIIIIIIIIFIRSQSERRDNKLPRRTAVHN